VKVEPVTAVLVEAGPSLARPFGWYEFVGGITLREGDSLVFCEPLEAAVGRKAPTIECGIIRCEEREAA
jgi:hypothetical protein